MHRSGFRSALILLALGIFAVSPVMAGDTNDLQDEVNRLRQQVDALSAQQQAMLEQEIDKYLDSDAAWQAAEAKESGVQGVSIVGRLTAVSQNTVGLDPSNRSIIAGDFDLDFWLQVNENIGMFIYMTGSATQGNFGDLEGADDFFDEASDFAPNFPFGFLDLTGTPTFAGYDGIGVDGTTPIRRGSVAVREAGVQWAIPVGSNTLNTEWGSLDVRRRFHTTRFSDDENTLFIHNQFDDASSISWGTDASGRTLFGLHMWISFGANQQFTLNWGYFNMPGRFWDHGQFYIQFAWKGEVSGREMNVSVMWLHDRMFPDILGTTDDNDNGWGATWDWLVTDAIGLFFKIAGNTKDVNPVELDWSIGAQWSNFMASRPDDVVGLAFGYIKANKNVLAGVPEDVEMTVEVYWKFMLEDGKMQITPHLIYVADPGGGIGWLDDSLFILGLRIFVPF